MDNETEKWQSTNSTVTLN